MAVHLSTLSSTGDRGTPTGTGDQYLSFDTWQSAQQGTIASGDTQVLECYRGTGEVTGGWQSGGEYIGTWTLSGWGTAADAYVHIRAAEGNGHDGVVSSANCFMLRGPATPWAGVLVLGGGSNYTVVSGFEVNSGRASDQYAVDISSTNVVIDSMMVINSSGGAGANTIGIQVANANTQLRNTLVTSFQYGVIVSAGGRYVAMSFDNLTVVKCTGGGIGYGDTQEMDNCVAHGNASWGFAHFHGGATSATNRNNASSDTTAPGTNPLHNAVDADFTDFTNNDFTPVAGNQLDGANNPAIDLSATFTNDIAGNTRVDPWERGAWEIAAAGGVTFDGPDIVDQTGTQDQPFSFDENGEGTVASRFSVS